VRAGVFRGPREVAVEDVEEPQLCSDGIVIDVRACGICGSDLHLFATGKAIASGQVMGHEFAGRVAQVGDEVREIAVGDRVAAMPLVPCWACPACRAGEVQLCVQAFAPGIGFGLPGAFAERLLIPGALLGRTVFKLPDDLGYEAGALLEPIAVAVHAVRRSGVRPGATAVVLGLGPIGQLVARVLRAGGVERIAGVERSEFRRECAERVGIATTAGGARLGPAVAEVLGADAAIDVVFECTGVPALAEQASRLARRGGTVTIVAVYEEPAPIDVSAFAVRELTIRGSSAYAPRDFADALRLLVEGTVTADDLVTDRTPLAELPEALARQARAPRSMKVLVEP
jgi:2-desacetyl-2-hydroxyethyl bacteriochlorophyllide A dehydrogenase